MSSSALIDFVFNSVVILSIWCAGRVDFWKKYIETSKNYQVIAFWLKSCCVLSWTILLIDFDKGRNGMVL